jgi:hypothetical protein
MTKVGSLCSGYHGLSLALPGEPVWFAENNPDMGRLLGKHYPDVPNYESIRPVVIDWARFERPDEIHAVERHVSVTGIEPPSPTEPNRNGDLRLSPAFAEWLMDLPAGWVTDGLDRKSALMGIGNGVVPRQARAAWEILNNACEPVGIPLEYGS